MLVLKNYRYCYMYIPIKTYIVTVQHTYIAYSYNDLMTEPG